MPQVRDLVEIHLARRQGGAAEAVLKRFEAGAARLHDDGWLGEAELSAMLSMVAFPLTAPAWPGSATLPRKAAAMNRRARRLDGTNYCAWMNEAHALVAMGDVGGAVSTLDAVPADSQGGAAAAHALGQICSSVGGDHGGGGRLGGARTAERVRSACERLRLRQHEPPALAPRDEL